MRPPTGVLPVISGTAPLLPLLQLLLSSPLLHVRSRVQGCSQGHRSRVCVRQHTPVSGATVDKMHRPQLAAANHCSARWSGCCTLLAERLISSSGTGAPRAMPLTEHSVSKASLASCWLERPPIGFCLSVCTFGLQAEIEALSFNPRRLSYPTRRGGEENGDARRTSAATQPEPAHMQK